MSDPDELFDFSDIPEEDEQEEPTNPWREPVASVDDEEPPAFVEYRDYLPEHTKVVSGPVGPAKQYPGQRFASRAAARKYWETRAGRIIEDLSIPGRWIFRVKKEA